MTAPWTEVPSDGSLYPPTTSSGKTAAVPTTPILALPGGELWHADSTPLSSTIHNVPPHQDPRPHHRALWLYPIAKVC
jgi:hypothetical protein